MEKILTSRKIFNETNVEFKGIIKSNIIERFIMWLIGLPREFTVTRAQLVDEITNGVKYYTVNDNKTLSEVKVINYKKGYLRSEANNTTGDNIDSLPIYHDFVG